MWHALSSRRTCHPSPRDLVFVVENLNAPPQLAVGRRRPSLISCVSLSVALGCMKEWFQLNDNVESSSFQFSIKKLLILTASIALLSSIGRIDRHDFSEFGILIQVYVVLINIYAWRFITTRLKLDQRFKWACFLAISLGCLPSLYFCVGSVFNDPFALPMSKWIGTPIWIFMIPSLSFVVFDLNDKWCTTSAFLGRSIIEMALIFPVWSIVWAFIQLYILEWAWL